MPRQGRQLAHGRVLPDHYLVLRVAMRTDDLVDILRPGQVADLAACTMDTGHQAACELKHELWAHQVPDAQWVLHWPCRLHEPQPDKFIWKPTEPLNMTDERHAIRKYDPFPSLGKWDPRLPETLLAMVAMLAASSPGLHRC